MKDNKKEASLIIVSNQPHSSDIVENSIQDCYGSLEPLFPEDWGWVHRSKNKVLHCLRQNQPCALAFSAQYPRIAQRWRSQRDLRSASQGRR